MNGAFLAPIGEPAMKKLKFDPRPLLDPSGDETDPAVKGQAYEMLREQGLVMWTTFKWDLGKKEASAWMPDSFVEMVSGQMWTVGLFRTDVWRPAFRIPAMARDTVTKGKSWGGEEHEDEDEDMGVEGLEI
ncbi:hypothetical protein G7Y89_g71 [Cudoniella acicularis]|uniref:Uncharacterized protein n=1 Tax=Cudoniella acicularis TaxID=354080 RepID=A0A8H4RYV4_9HELO|nr:hypothetical protein G7Y89_g71 [Cudoniella acicularis]